MLIPLLAVHIPDGVLTPSWCLGGWVVIAVLLALSSWRLQPEEIPRLALASAACFVASSIHLPIGVTSVHLLLNCVAVLLAGPRAALAIFPALLLQALLLNHGGLIALGINSAVSTLPAILVWGLTWLAVSRWPLLVSSRWVWLTGLLCGGLTALTTVFLNALVLYLGGLEAWSALVAVLFVAHIPVVVAEACITAPLMVYLYRVDPGLLALPQTLRKISTPYGCPASAEGSK